MKRTTLLRVGFAATAAFLAAACAAAAPAPHNTAAQPFSPPTVAPSQSAAPTASPRATGVCADMNRHDCMHSLDCVLEATGSNAFPALYRCRSAESACEKDLAQIAFYETTPPEGLCTARKGCRYEKPGCYCRCRGYGRTSVADGAESPECNCVCAGGNPPLCLTAK